MICHQRVILKDQLTDYGDQIPDACLEVLLSNDISLTKALRPQVARCAASEEQVHHKQEKEAEYEMKANVGCDRWHR